MKLPKQLPRSMLKQLEAERIARKELAMLDEIDRSVRRIKEKENMDNYLGEKCVSNQS